MRSGFLNPSVGSYAARAEKGDEDASSLVEAVRADNFGVFCWLLLARPDLVEARDSSTPGSTSADTPVLAAARHRSADARYTELLVAAGADTSVLDARCQSAVHLVAQHKGLAQLRTLKALLASARLGSSFDVPSRVTGHRALDACGSYEAHQLLLVATAWLSVGAKGGPQRAVALTRVGPFVFVVAAFAVERLVPTLAPLFIVGALGTAFWAWRPRAVAAAIAAPQSQLGLGVSVALTAACALSTATMLHGLRRAAALAPAEAYDNNIINNNNNNNEYYYNKRGRRIDDATLLSYGHLVLNVMAFAACARCCRAPASAMRRVFHKDERTNFTALALSKPGAFATARFCTKCAAFRPHSPTSTTASPGDTQPRRRSSKPSSLMSKNSWQRSASEEEDEEDEEELELELELDDEGGKTQEPAWTHCARCARCVFGRDHHCALLGTCVAAHNQRTFCVLLSLTVLCGVSGFRIAAWAFALRCGFAAPSPLEPNLFASAVEAPWAFARCAFLGPRGPTAWLHFVIVPLACVFVSYSLAEQLLLIAGVDPYDMIDRAEEQRLKNQPKLRRHAHSTSLDRALHHMLQR